MAFGSISKFSVECINTTRKRFRRPGCCRSSIANPFFSESSPAQPPGANGTLLFVPSLNHTCNTGGRCEANLGAWLTRPGISEGSRFVWQIQLLHTAGNRPRRVVSTKIRRVLHAECPCLAQARLNEIEATLSVRSPQCQTTCAARRRGRERCV